MRKIEKLALRKIVKPADILKKKQMGNLWGGERWCCTWSCTIGAYGTGGHDGGFGWNSYHCWDEAEAKCPFPDYGIRIIDNC